MYISETIEKKRKTETELYETFIKYIYKYISKIYVKTGRTHIRKNVHVDFQKRLIQIAKWDSTTVNKEYYKFLKWCKRRYNYEERDLQKMLHTIITLTTAIMIHKSSDYTQSLLETFDFPKVETFYYGCLKRIARYFYENPKSIRDVSSGTLRYYVDTILNTLLPLKHITSVLEYHSDNSSESTRELIVEYDFEKSVLSDSESVDSKRHKSIPHVTDTALIVEKRTRDTDSDSDSLKYISSEELPERESNSGSAEDTTQALEHSDNEVKHVKIPVVKRAQYYYRNLKYDEQKEPFFDE